MKFARKRCYVAAIFVLSLFVLGCREKSPSERKTEQALRGVWDILPEGTGQVIALDVKALAESALVQRAISALAVRDPKSINEINDFMKGCELSWGVGLSRITLALWAKETESRQAILVAEGAFAEGALSACLHSTVAKRGGKFTSDQGTYQLSLGEDAPLFLWFPKTGYAVVSRSAEALAACRSEGKKLGENSEMQAIFAAAEQTRPIWFAGTVPPEIAAGFAKASKEVLTPPKSMNGFVDPENRSKETPDAPSLQMELAVDFGKMDDAGQVVALLAQQVGELALMTQDLGLGQIVAKAAVNVDKTWAILSLNVTHSELDRLLAQKAMDAPAVPIAPSAPAGE